MSLTINLYSAIANWKSSTREGSNQLSKEKEDRSTMRNILCITWLSKEICKD